MSTRDRLEQAYERATQHVYDWLQLARQEGRQLENWFKEAADSAVEAELALEELTKEEADTVINYLAQDLHEAAEFSRDAEKSLAFWLKFDAALLEDRFEEAFRHSADPTTMGQYLLSRQLEARSELHTGHMTGAGTLACKDCGKEMHFHKPGHIPPCAGCGGTQFERVTNEA